MKTLNITINEFFCATEHDCQSYPTWGDPARRDNLRQCCRGPNGRTNGPEAGHAPLHNPPPFVPRVSPLVVQRSSEKLFSRLVARFDTDTSPSSTRTKASTRTSLRGLSRGRHAISLVVIIIGVTTRLAHCLLGPSSVSSFVEREIEKRVHLAKRMKVRRGVAAT